MEAIIELIVAWIAALVRAVIGAIFGFLLLLFALSEFALCLLTQDRQTAFRRFQQRLERKQQADFQEPSLHETPAVAETPAKWQPTQIILVCLTTLTIVVVVVFYQIHEHRQTANVEATKQQVKTLAQTYIQQINAGGQIPEKGPLTEQDAWQHPLELFVDQLAGGCLIVVRSAGRDGKTGTVDDLLGIEAAGPNPAKVVEAAFQQGWKTAGKRLQNLLPAKQPDDPAP